MDKSNRIKIVVLGSFAAGKTSICQKYVNGKFDEKYLTTVGVKVYEKEILSPQKILLSIWDIANDCVTNVTPIEYLKGAQAALIVADLTKQSSVKEISLHMDMVLQVNKNIKAILVLNKIDLHPTWEDGLATAKEIMQAYSNNWIAEPFVISAKDDEFDNIFMEIVKSIIGG